MKIRPLHDRILVKRLDEESKTAGGLFIPDTAKEKPIQATVIAVGAGKRDKDGKVIALAVKAGDRVLFSKYSGRRRHSLANAVKVTLGPEGPQRRHREVWGAPTSPRTA
jgi:chaperonin GroES